MKRSSMRLRFPKSRFRRLALLGLVVLVALGLAGWRIFWSPSWVWRRAVHGEDRVAQTAAWEQVEKGQIAGMTKEETEKELASALEDTHFPVRFGAVRAIRFSNRDASEAIPLLIPRLKDEDLRIRRAAVSAIRHTVEKGGSTRDLAEPALLSALDDEAPEVRRQAIDAIGTVVSKARRVDDPLIKRLAATLKDPDEHVRIQAAFELVRLGKGDETLPMLKAYVAEHREKPEGPETAASVERALIALSKLAEGSDDSVDFLLDGAYRKEKPLENPTSLSLQLATLGNGRDRVIARLREALKGKDLDRKIAAALVLERVGSAGETVPTWIEALQRQEDRQIRIHAVFALRNLQPPDPRALAALKDAAKDDDPEVVKYAAEGVKMLEQSRTP